MPLILSSLHSHHVSVRGFKIVCWLTTSLKTRNHHHECSIFFIQVQSTAFPLCMIKSLLNGSFQLCSYVIHAVQNRLSDWELIFVFSVQPCLRHCCKCGHECMPLVGGKWTIHLLNHGCIVLWHTDFLEPFIFVVTVYDSIWRTVIWDPGL
jgi:hypothetical protein